MLKPSLLLFDLGGVLIENSTFDSLKCLLPAPLDAHALKNKGLDSSAVRRFELGEISPIEFSVSFIAEWDISLAPDDFLEKFTSWPIGFYPDAREALYFLRQRYRVGCLSNSNVLHWKKFDGFKDDFDIAISSHQLGAIKPDDEAFIRTLAVCDVEPSAVYFFDDSAGNIRSANRLGIRAFHVDGIGQLLKILSE
jgi:putative hydrolase of the HAD superfamily